MREISYETAGGHRFAALEWGSPDGPLALLMHGFPDTAWTYRHLGPMLAERGFRAVAPFMRGYAPTGPFEGETYEFGALASDVLAAREALNGDERTVVVGHDFGAAAMYPAVLSSPAGTFAKAVSLAIPAGFELIFGAARSKPLTVAKQVRNIWYMGFHQLPVLPEALLDRLVPKYYRDWSPGFDASEDVARFFEAVPTREHRTAVLRYYRSMLQPWERSSKYKPPEGVEFSLDIPLLYLHGADDGCILPDWAEPSGELFGPNATVEVIPDCGHFLHLERPDVVNERIAAFVAA